MKKIALIEDNYHFYDNLRTLLAFKNFKIEVFKTLKAAEDGLEYYNPDLILTDLNMPDGDGSNTIEKLRKNTFFNYTPIIIITGSSNIDNDKLLSLGVYKVLTKPVPFKTLHYYILKSLKKRERYLVPINFVKSITKLFKPAKF